MTRHLAKLLDTLWYAAMGLFLGLMGGLVFAVIRAFKGAEYIDASPGIEPFNNIRFEAFHNDAVAGYIGQSLFVMGGLTAMALLMIAVIAHFLRDLCFDHLYTMGSKLSCRVQTIAVLGCFILMAWSTIQTLNINSAWPGLYDLEASDQVLAERREAFEVMHQKSERIASSAWVLALVALAITPWCRQPTATALQFADGQKENSQEEKA